MDYRYEGIIIAKYDSAGMDRIYSIYTKEAGKIRVLGKSVKSPNAKLAGNLEPVTLAEINISRTKGLGKITSAVAVDNFLAIKSDYSLTARVFYIFGIIDRMMADSERDEKIFQLMVECLETMEKLSGRQPDKKESENKVDIVTLGFLFKFLEEAGYKINVEKCVRCGKKLADGVNYFQSNQGGFSCNQCLKNGGVKSSAGAIKLIRIFLKNKISNFGKISASEKDVKNIKLIGSEMVKWIMG